MTVSTEIRTLIVKQHKKGKTPMEISDNLEVDLRTVQRIVKQYNETGDVTPKVSTGRHRLLSPRDERELLTMRREPTTRPSTLRHTLSTKVSARTVRRTLARCGIHPYRQRRKLRLTPAQRHARLEWALEYAKKPASFWDSVIFSDESSFHTHETMKGRFVWRFPHEELALKMVQPMTKFGGHKIQVWGCLPKPPQKGLEDMLQHLPTSLSRCCMTIVHILQEGVAPTCWPGGGSKVSPSFGLLDVVKILNSTYRKKTLSNMSSKTRHHQERYLLQSLFQFQVF